MNLAEKLNKYSKDYWDFQDYRKEAPLVRYPAIMVAPMQECILREVINADSSIKMCWIPFQVREQYWWKGKNWDLMSLALILIHWQFY